MKTKLYENKYKALTEADIKEKASSDALPPRPYIFLLMRIFYNPAKLKACFLTSVKLLGPVKHAKIHIN